MEPIPPSVESNKPQPRKHSLASRILTATAFSTIGVKIGTLGTIVDANSLLSGGGLTIGQKVKSAFNGTLFTKLGEKTIDLMENENKSLIGATASTMKYTLAATAAGTAAGAVLGWVRGGRIESWKDIFKHPWRSTKIILGFASPVTTPAPVTSTVEKPIAVEMDVHQDQQSEAKKKFSHDIQPRGSHEDAITIEKNAIDSSLNRA